MGYTHYFNRAALLPAKAFKAAVKDCRNVLAQTGVPLAGPMGDGQPVVDADVIAFDGHGAHCESLHIARCERLRGHEQRKLDFCKTNHRPYDLCVQAALIVFAHHFGDAFLVTSDGQDADWDPARKRCQEDLGYGQDFRLANRG